MAIATGINGILKINTGTLGSPTYTTISGQRSATLTFSKNSVDVTHKGDAGWERTLGISRGVSISCEGFADEADPGFQELRNVFWNNVQDQFQFVTPGAVTYTGTFELESLDETSPYDDAASFSCTLKSVGVITKT
jgi:TP901-1 family phage major tail protein